LEKEEEEEVWRARRVKKRQKGEGGVKSGNGGLTRGLEGGRKLTCMRGSSKAPWRLAPARALGSHTYWSWFEVIILADGLAGRLVAFGMQ
jgi:hypothetical protein